MKRDGPISRQHEFMIQERQSCAFVCAGRQHTQSLDTSFRTQPNVVGRGAAGLDTESSAPFRSGIVGSTNGDSAAHGLVRQDSRPPGAAVVKPSADGFGDSLADDGRYAEAPVE